MPLRTAPWHPHGRSPWWPRQASLPPPLTSCWTSPLLPRNTVFRWPMQTTSACVPASTSLAGMFSSPSSIYWGHSWIGPAATSRTTVLPPPPSCLAAAPPSCPAAPPRALCLAPPPRTTPLPPARRRSRTSSWWNAKCYRRAASGTQSVTETKLMVFDWCIFPWIILQSILWCW